MYLTIIKSEGQNLFMVRQLQIALRDVNPFEQNQIHSLTLSETIEVSLLLVFPSALTLFLVDSSGDAGREDDLPTSL